MNMKVQIPEQELTSLIEYNAKKAMYLDGREVNWYYQKEKELQTRLYRRNLILNLNSYETNTLRLSRRNG